MEYHYPDFKEIERLKSDLQDYAQLKCEQGAFREISNLVKETEVFLKNMILTIQATADDPSLEKKEPNSLVEIQALRPHNGPRKIWKSTPDTESPVLREKMEGALLGRFIGCLLGVPVEGWTSERIHSWSESIAKGFPPVDYWEQVERPYEKNCYGHYRHEYEKSEMVLAPVDDDIIYTQLALLILEEYGPNFTTEQVGAAWKKYLPVACTAEDVALRNLKQGIPAANAASIENPYYQWIGAAIRSDGFGWAAAGYPEKAAKMAYYDAYLSHRRNGIYGEMFLAAAQSAAFAVKNPIEAVRVGMTEIPMECRLYQDLEWALSVSNQVKNYQDACRLVAERFGSMHPVHTNNNLCLIVFGLSLSDGDFLRGVSQTVAMGYDNDCTAASVGSILGALCGKRNIPQYLYEPFHNTVDTYLTGVSPFQLDQMADRFLKLIPKVYGKV